MSHSCIIFYCRGRIFRAAAGKPGQGTGKNGHEKTGDLSDDQISGAPAKESMRQDLNLRPLRPERSALPN